MNNHMITVTEVGDWFVRYTFSTGGSGFSGRKWFPNVAKGQVWKMACLGALVISCERVS